MQHKIIKSIRDKVNDITKIYNISFELSAKKKPINVIIVIKSEGIKANKIIFNRKVRFDFRINFSILNPFFSFN